MNNNRKPNQSRIRRTVAAVLIVAALVVVVGVVLVAQCLSFDENGAHVIDRYGVLARDGSQLENVIEEEPEEEEETEVEPEEEQPVKQEDCTRAVMLSKDTVSDAEAQAQLMQLAQDGVIDTVVVTIKDSEGNLNISVETDEMEDVQYLVSSGAESLETSIGALKEAGVHVIGRIYCFHDSLATKRNSDLAIQYELGGTWLDYDNTRWLDPTNPGAAAYIADIARSAVQAGCDEIMLSDVTFPPRGHLDRAEFDTAPSEQTAVLASVVEEVQSAVGSVPVSLTADTVSGLTELSVNGEEDGIPVGDVGKLLDTAHRLFIPVDSGDVNALEQTIHALCADAVVVPIFLSGETWKAHSGDAVLNGIFDGDSALDTLKNS